MPKFAPDFEATIHQRVPTALRAQMDKIAAEKGQRLSFIVRAALESYVREFNSQSKTPAA